MYGIAVQNGQSIARGTYLGQTGEGATCIGGSAIGAHLHFAIQQNNVDVVINGVDLGGWTVEQGAIAGQGCMVRIQNGERKCASGTTVSTYTANKIYNDGTNAELVNPSWDFRNGAGGWTIGNSLSNQTQEPVGLWFNVAGTDSQLLSPFISVPAANYSRIAITMASTTDTCRQLYFKREGDVSFSEDRAFYTQVIADGSTTTFYFDVSTNPNWQGTITQLRFDPACDAVNGHAIRIDQIVFTVTPTPVTPTPVPNYSVWLPTVQD